MKFSNFLRVLVPLFLSINYVQCIRNLFLPKTGDISGISASSIAENLSNVTNFQSLLGAGRSLAYPFAAGVLIAISSLANENNWKVSDAGFSKVLGVPREEIVESYGALLETLVTVCYTFSYMNAFVSVDLIMIYLNVWSEKGKYALFLSLLEWLCASRNQ